MTNTIFGLLSLLFVVTLIALWGSCNRNSTKTETNINNTTDTLTQTIDSLHTTEKVQNDSINLEPKEDETTNTISDTTKSEVPALKENSLVEDTVIKDADTKTSVLTEESKSAADFKENIKKPETKASGGLKAADNIKDVLSDNKTKGRIIIIGSGGGVTGAVTTYKVFEDGSLFENHTLNANQPQKKLSILKEVEALQKQFDALNIESIKLNAPGNMYFFVGYEEDGKSHRCTWGANDTEVPDNLKTFYTNTMNTISENQQQNR